MSSLSFLSPLQLGSLHLKNRIFLAPLTRGRCGRSQLPDDLVAEYYSQRAQSCGLLVSEGTLISKGGTGWAGAPGIYTSEHSQAWKPVIDKIHENNGIIFVQLWHMGRVAGSCFYGLQPVAPSAIPAHGQVTDFDLSKHPYEVPRALTTEEIPIVVEEYVNAARHAKEAGFDGIELHGANGYLIDQFLQSSTNQRDDHYGGSFENRFRFLREIIQGCSAVYPLERIAVKLSPNGVFGSMGSEDNYEAFTYYGSELNKIGVRIITLMDGLGFGFHQKCAQFTLQDLRKVYNGIVVGNVGYDKDSVNAAIEAGHADAISIGRLLIANPDLANRWANNYPLNPPAGHEVYWNYPGFPELENRSVGYTDFPVYQA